MAATKKRLRKVTKRLIKLEKRIARVQTSLKTNRAQAATRLRRGSSQKGTASAASRGKRPAWR
jgi:lipid II:glycine glycyltransferase (peptidoglycan interpeptide bridge formation enzyme)